MKLESFRYDSQKGWSCHTFPALDSENTLIIIFASPSYINNPTPLLELSKHYPKSKIIGCSSAGEISGKHIFDESLSVAIMQFEATEIKLVKTKINDANDSLAAGETIAELLYDPKLRGMFILSDGLNVNGSELVKGLNRAQKHRVVITGGLAGDGNQFKKTWSFYQNEIVTKHVIGVGFYGEQIRLGHGSCGGWNIFGPERRITRSKNNILYELDGLPALSLYKNYLGERANGLPATGLLYPLAIRKSLDKPQQVVRTILAVDEKEQSLTFAGDVPEGYLAQLMRANFDRLITAAEEAGELSAQNMLKQYSPENPALAIAISCVGRRLLLGERTEEETESTLESLPQGTHQIGFYSYGELSPHETGECDLHNQTMTLTTIYEE